MNHVQLLRCAVQFIAGCSGVLLAILIWGRATPAEITARQQLAEFVELSPAVQERVQLAWRAFREQDLDGQTRVLELHQAVTREPQLANTLERYTTWWTSLKDLERDELRALGEPELLKEITSRYAADQSQQQASEITVVFNPWLFFGRFGGRGGDRSRPPEGEPGSDRTLSPLTLTTSQYADLMQQVVDAPGLDIEVPEMATKLTAPENRLLLNCLLLQNATLAEQPTEQRIEVLRVVNDLLLEKVPDPEWCAEYRRRIERSQSVSRWYSVLIPQLMVRSLVLQMGQRLRGQISLDEDAVIDEFAAITDANERRDLMVRRPEDAVRRIEQKVFASQQATDSPERQLVRMFLANEQRMNAVMRSPSLVQRLLLPGVFGGGASGPSGGRPPGGPGRVPRDRPRP
jgi:hypothetical protein